MSTWAIVPVKPFLQSKTRLASSLSPEERADLSRQFLTQTLQMLALVPAIRQTVVVSRDAQALVLARQCGALAVTEAHHSDLNAALTSATNVAVSGGATAVLALPTDLPLLSAEALSQFVDEAAQPAITIVPDRHATGTNALLVRPPGLIPYAFGPGSFQQHLALAAAAGIVPRICHLPDLALDIDTPDDLRLYSESKEISE